MPDGLDWLVHIAPGAGPGADPSGLRWTDITQYARKKITITRGRPDEAGQTPPARCTLRLNNAGGRFVARNALAPWYPLLRKGTLLRARKRHARDTFTRTVSNGLGTSDYGQVWTALGGSSAWSVGSGVATASISVVNSIRRVLLGVNLLNAERRISITPSLALVGASLVWLARFRYQDTNNSYGLSVELDRNTGAGLTVTCKIRKTVAGVTTELAVASPVPGLLYTAGQPVHCRAAVHGRRLAVKAWVGDVVTDEPDGWSLTAIDGSFNIRGSVGEDVYLAAGNTNVPPYTATIDNYELYVDRFTGTLDELPVQWTPGLTDCYVDATASDVARRRGQGNPPVRSALQMTMEALTPRPVAYWLMQEGRNATQLAGNLSGEPIGLGDAYSLPSEVPLWGEGTLAPWFPRVASLTAGGRIVARAPRITGTQWAVDHVFNMGTNLGSGTLGPDFAVYVPSDRATGYPTVDWAIGIGPAGVTATDRVLLELYELDAEGFGPATVLSDRAVTLYDGQPHHIRLTAAQNGTSIDWALYVDGVASTGAVTTTTLRAIGDIEINPQFLTPPGDWAVGHLTIWDTASPPLTAPEAFSAVTGYAGENAGHRVDRVCRELDIPASVYLPSTTVLMGPQPASAPLPILRECESTDHGILCVRADGLVSYLAHTDRENLSPTMALPFTAVTTFVPVDDDQRVENDITVTRPSGSSARYVDEDDIAEQGSYEGGGSVNVNDDADLIHQAGWVGHLGTVDDLRYPDVLIDVHAHPELADAALSCDVGARVTISGPPSELGTALVDQVMLGYTERLDKYQWEIEPNFVPAKPWDVSVADGGQRYPATGSAVGSGGLAAGGTSFALTSTASNGVWSTDPANYPQNLRIGWHEGEVVTVSGISGGTSPQTVTITARGVNGITRAWPAGAPVDVEHPAITPL